MGRTLISICLLVMIPVCSMGQQYGLSDQVNDVHTSLRGLDSDKNGMVWTSGSNGTIGYSDDYGMSWHFIVVPGMENAEFRDIEMAADGSILVMSSVLPAAILRSEDNGMHFEVVFSRADSAWFLDGMDIHASGWGLCYGDPINGRMTVLETTDFGKTWKESNAGPLVSEGTAAFAASGSGIQIVSGKKAYFVTGGMSSDLYRTKDRGRTWEHVSGTGLPSAPTSGAYGMFIKGRKIYVTGGDYVRETDTSGVFRYSLNRGRTWRSAAIPPGGYRSAISMNKDLLITCGPTGVDFAEKGRKLTFQHWSDTAYHTISVSGNFIYLAGSDGRTGVIFPAK